MSFCLIYCLHSRCHVLGAREIKINKNTHTQQWYTKVENKPLQDMINAIHE